MVRRIIINKTSLIYIIHLYCIKLFKNNFTLKYKIINNSFINITNSIYKYVDYLLILR